MAVNQPQFTPPNEIDIDVVAMVGVKPDDSFAYVNIDVDGQIIQAP